MTTKRQMRCPNVEQVENLTHDDDVNGNGTCNHVRHAT